MQLLEEAAEQPELIWLGEELTRLRAMQRGIGMPFLRIWDGQKGIGILAGSVDGEAMPLKPLGTVIREILKPMKPDVVILGICLIVDERPCDLLHVEMYEGCGNVCVYLFHDGDELMRRGEPSPLGRMLS